MGRLLLGVIAAAVLSYFGPEEWTRLQHLPSSGSSGLTFWGGGLPSALVSAAIASVIAILALRVNSGVNLRNKRIDVIIHCNNRYEDLYKLRLKLVEAKASESERRKPENSSGREKNPVEVRQAVRVGRYADMIGGQIVHWLSQQIDHGGGVSRRISQERIEDEEAAYFKRYWALKSDQFDYWLAGYVDHETIVSWTMQMADSLSHPGIGETSLNYKANLPEMRKSNEVINPRFVELVEFIFKYIGPMENRRDAFLVLIHYLRIVEKKNVRLINKLSKSSFGRLRMPEYAEVLRNEAREQYLHFSPSNPISKLWGTVIRFWRMPPSTPWNQWVAEAQLGRLKERLEMDNRDSCLIAKAIWEKQTL